MEIKTTPLSEFGIDESILAHPPSETLQEHSDLTIEYCKKIIDKKNLEEILNTLISSIDNKNFELIKQIFFDAIYLHDIGKKNPIFQAKKMNNSKFKEYIDSTQSSDHSPLSTDEYIQYYSQKLQNFKRIDRYRLEFILHSFAYAISKHHGHLSEFFEFKKESKEAKNYQTYLDRLAIPHFEFYILNKLLFSLLVSSDYYATTDFMANLKIDDFGVLNDSKKEQLQEKFTEYLKSFGEPKGINKLRVEMFEEAQKNLLKNLDKNIFYLEAPTGSGKTITSINLALKLLQNNERLNKLFYIFPFNTLVEQTKSVFDEIFKDKLDISVINSITPIKEEEGNYTKSYVNRLFFHSPTVITTHVTLFNILFGTSKEDNFPLWQLANSVIIIDEIQSYNNNLWWYMVEFFEQYAKWLNIKIIIMSATLPKLDYFLEKKDNFVELIGKEKRDKLFSHTLFRDRVKIDYELLNRGKIDFEDLEEFFYKVRDKNKRVLFEFIKKDSAREFYEILKQNGENVYELSGDDNKAYREYVINKTKNDEPIIIVATQVIEAGVDIDMDLGFKDISTLDSEEQFMGRINRSCERSGKVYFFDMDDASGIYRGDNRIGFDLTQEKYQKILQNKDFALYYNEVLERIKNRGERLERGVKSNIENFTELVKKLNYKELSFEMTLINSQNFTLYCPFKIDISIYKGIKEFEDKRVKEFLTDGKLDGQKVWEKYLELSEIEDFAQKEVEKSYINSLMQFFTFNIIKFNDKSRPCIGEEIGGYYYIANYEDYITKDGKFNRKAYQEQCRSLFL